MPGNLPKIIQQPSPNFGARRENALPDMIVLHHTAMETAQAACDRLCDSSTEVSAHYVISECGEIIQLVAENNRAWHAGAGTWAGVSDINSRSIGIELANSGPLHDLPPFSDPQIQALEALLSDIKTRWAIVNERIIGHSDMAPDRKFDPGPKFDWRRLAIGGLSIWPSYVSHQPVDWETFKTHAKCFGYYAAKDTKAGWDAVLKTFRLRFRPDKVGDLDEVDMGIISSLATKWPAQTVDPST